MVVSNLTAGLIALLLAVAPAFAQDAGPTPSSSSERSSAPLVRPNTTGETPPSTGTQGGYLGVSGDKDIPAKIPDTGH